MKLPRIKLLAKAWLTVPDEFSDEDKVVKASTNRFAQEGDYLALIFQVNDKALELEAINFGNDYEAMTEHSLSQQFSFVPTEGGHASVRSIGPVANEMDQSGHFLPWYRVDGGGAHTPMKERKYQGIDIVDRITGPDQIVYLGKDDVTGKDLVKASYNLKGKMITGQYTRTYENWLQNKEKIIDIIRIHLIGDFEGHGPSKITANCQLLNGRSILIDVRSKAIALHSHILQNLKAGDRKIEVHKINVIESIPLSVDAFDVIQKKEIAMAES